MQWVVIYNDKGMLNSWHDLFLSRDEQIACHYVDLHTTALLSDEIKPTIVLFLAKLSSVADAQARQQFQLQLLNWLAIAKQNKAMFLFLSSAAVFNGDQLYYEENAKTCPKESYGQFYVGCEAQVSQYDRYIILRTGWLFSSTKGEFLAEVIDFAKAKKMIPVNSAGKGCPTALTDLVRVIFGMCLQLELSIPSGRLFHYMSQDSAIGFQFIETVLSHASQFSGDIDPKNVFFQHQVNQNSLFYFEPVILKCNKLSEQFGIQQRTWRSYVGDAVKSYTNTLVEAKK